MKRFLTWLLGFFPEAAKPLPSANDLRLKLIRSIYITDAWDGRSSVVDGIERTLIIYDDEIVARQYVYRVGGSAENRTKLPSKDAFVHWNQMSHLASAYLRVLNIANAAYLTQKIDAGENDFLTDSLAKRNELAQRKEGWDKVHINEATLNVLTEHPDFKDAVQGFNISFELISSGQYRVKTEKIKEAA